MEERGLSESERGAREGCEGWMGRESVDYGMLEALGRCSPSLFLSSGGWAGQKMPVLL